MVVFVMVVLSLGFQSICFGLGLELKALALLILFSDYP